MASGDWQCIYASVRFGRKFKFKSIEIQPSNLTSFWVCGLMRIKVSQLASSLRKSFHADDMIEDRKRLGFAHVCIEVHVSSHFPPYIELYQEIDEFSSDPKIARILVEYQWVPSVYQHCKVFGHQASTAFVRLSLIPLLSRLHFLLQLMGLRFLTLLLLLPKPILILPKLQMYIHSSL